MHALPRSLFIFAFCVPLAIVFGVMLASPLDRKSMMLVAAGFFLLVTPLLLKSHHGLLILSCQAFVNIYFLPGQPQLWLIAAAASCFFSILTLTLNRGKISILNISSVSWSLIVLLVVTAATAHFTGGVGSYALGSAQYGGRRYFYLWGAIAVYFAISAFAIPAGRERFYASGFFLASLTSAVGNIAVALGPAFYFLFLLFPSEYAILQALGDDMRYLARIQGLGPAGTGIVCFILLRYGIRGTFDVRHFWRLLLFVLGLGIGLMSGFRSVIVFVLLLLAALFVLEGLHKTRYLAVAMVTVALITAVAMPFANRLPIAIQRCLTVFPLDLDLRAIEDARGSSEWRLEMWRAIIPDIPKYFWMGKGYSIDPKDMYFAYEGLRLGGATPYEGALVAGDYHNGPLTLIIPFGIWGVLAFLWFVAASSRVLWNNYRNSGEEFKTINTFLLAYFVAKLMYFTVIFGAFYIDLLYFTATVALSISLNRGMLKAAQRASVPVKVRKPEPLLQPGGLQPA